MSPCGARRRSATGRDLLAGRVIKVGTELVDIDAWCALESRYCGVGADEPMATQWGQLADRNTISGHDERLALVELAHDLAAVVAQLALGDFGSHIGTVARVLQLHFFRTVASTRRDGVRLLSRW